MPYVIAEACIDVMDRSCLDECPVDCVGQPGGAADFGPVGTDTSLAASYQRAS